MMDSLYVAATGMHAERAQLDTVANNLANMNTDGFKASRVNFKDLLYRQTSQFSSVADMHQAGGQIGLGTGVASISRDFSVGDLRSTQNPLDLAIQGNGFFEVRLENGDFAFTRNGALKLDSEGYLATQSGHRLAGNIQIPPDATDILITSTGEVEVKLEKGAPLYQVGLIELVDFVNPASLEALGNNLYMKSELSGAPSYAEPGQMGTGSLLQGYLEASNVSLIEEMMRLVATQSAYQASSQIIRATDEMLRINNGLRT